MWYTRHRILSLKPVTFRYKQELLNEFLKEHRKVEEQGATIAKQQKQIEALTTGLQKVSDELELRKPAPQRSTISKSCSRGRSPLLAIAP